MEEDCEVTHFAPGPNGRRARSADPPGATDDELRVLPDDFQMTTSIRQSPRRHT